MKCRKFTTLLVWNFYVAPQTSFHEAKIIEQHLSQSGSGCGLEAAARDASHEMPLEAAEAGPHQGLPAHGGGVHPQPGASQASG